ncbi:MAG: carbohydrate ABC transporter permease [Candidatus Aenigmatarchaeota archaeon]
MDFKGDVMKKAFSIRRNILVAVITITLLGFIWIIPLYALIVGSVKSLADAMGSPLLDLPRELDAGTLYRAFNILSTAMQNTAVVVIPAAFISVFLGSVAAFGIYLKGGRVADYLPPLIAITTYIPYQALIVPLISIIRELEKTLNVVLYDTLHGMFLVFLLYYTPMATLLMFIFTNNLPRELIEASLVDGMSPFKAYRRVALPLLSPGFVAALIFILINMWNNFFIPLSMTRGYEKHITLRIFSYVGQAGTIYNEMFAAALIGSLPPLVVFIVLSRYFVRGLMAFTGGGR